jgi:2-amino-4-hydroxy-6-hydroxymethyldihydropteridine diphosphokinase
MKTEQTRQDQPSTIIYLGLGNNTGDREANLEAAIQSLPPKVEVLRRSPIYQTPPWRYTDQPDFLNLVIEGATQLSPTGLLNYLKDLEKEVGRTASFHWGPREIDIDILLFGTEIFSSPQLTIPHPQMHNRAFVLVPLADLVPDLVHPVLNQKISDLASALEVSEIQPYTPEKSAKR